MTRVERQVIKRSHPLWGIIDDMCFKAKNLYNYANYILRQEFIQNNNRGNSYARRGSYERGRSNRRSYGRMESRDDFMDRFEELMDEAPDEATRKKFEKLMMEMK